VAAFTWLEIRRARLAWFAILMVLGGSALAEFAATLAITESDQYRMVVYAVFIRLAAVFVMALLVATSVQREFDDQTIALVLSRPVERWVWYAGKLLGFALTALLLTSIAVLPLVVQAGATAVWWGAALFCELLIVAAAALTFAITLRHVTVVLSVVAAFYLLSRSIAVMTLMSRGPTVDTGSVSAPFIALITDAIAYVLPELYRFANAGWFVTPVDMPAEFAAIAMQTLIYTLLLGGVGLVDLYRRNI
jgi:ABC-type transport system involved in multi-copper enzyme maturation permease subunit